MLDGVRMSKAVPTSPNGLKKLYFFSVFLHFLAHFRFPAQCYQTRSHHV